MQDIAEHFRHCRIDCKRWPSGTRRASFLITTFAAFDSLMLSNQSIPDSVVIPVLGYPTVDEAVSWLCKAFGFVERLRIADHRAQLIVPGGGAMVVTQSDATVANGATHATHAIMVRVDNADAHFQRSSQHGAVVVRAPTDQPYGERQYTVVDLGGHSWTFTQSIADVAPSSWGGTLVNA